MPPGLAASLRRWGRQLIGLVLIVIGFALALALVTFDPGDPSFNRATADTAHNLLGRPGAYAADLLLQSIGIAGALFALVPAVWGWRLLTARSIAPLWFRLTIVPIAVIIATVAFAAIPAPESWPLRAGLGGIAGALLLTNAVKIAAALGLGVGATIVGAVAGLVALLALSVGLAMTGREWLAGSAATMRGLWRSAVVGARSIAVSARGIARLFRRRSPRPARPKPEKKEKVQRRTGSKRDRGSTVLTGERAEPRLNLSAEIVEPPEPPAPKRAAERRELAPRSRVQPRQASLALGGDYSLPSLDFLSEPVQSDTMTALDEAALNNNAQMLETVLEDFGIAGQVTKVRPGPVVTLYEFEPAPGIKSSRIVNLSDDIARSMSAVSVRVAVIPGRTVLGIELPNGDRETVFLRELLASDALERSKAALGLMLGKDIGGSPVVADLARMPHLLIAGTTGSGKSVAINTMILSLLYRLTPEQCRFIMIDPKMLELAVYDDIPHLLAPVVTDPRKAIVALKWVVREMEERYQAMSKLGVRNIQGFNTRLADARKKREVLKKKVQTGFDPETGKPIYEEQDLDLTPLPYIVVVVDEMADLMLVAGKDIEIAVQRLAQMARAAGIHLIMATQRPSVDVITGTIKANFPTRVSFQVTSKIDSRTILGEQGAEQLLGQGDMLYMAGGGRITRVHGPFVSDGEVEDVVRFLKSQGQPDYLDDVTEAEDGSAFGGLDLGRWRRQRRCGRRALSPSGRRGRTRRQGVDQLHPAPSADRLQPRRAPHRAHGIRGRRQPGQSRRQARSPDRRPLNAMTIIMRNTALAVCAVVTSLVAVADDTQAALSAADRQVVARVENYLNAIRTMTARFIQAEPNGWIAEGRIYLQRPGKMRIEYDPPHRFLMVTTGRMMIVYNGETDATMHLPMSASPVSFLLAKRIDLRRNAEVRRVVRRPDSVELTVTKRGGGPASLRLVFRRKPFGIKEWTVIDGKRKAVRVVLLEPRIGHPIDPVKFLFAKPGRQSARGKSGRPPKVKSMDLN